MFDLDKIFSLKGIGIILLVLLGFFGFYKLIESSFKEEQKIVSKVISEGYSIDDVRIFLKGTDYTIQDFVISPSLRNQYKEFQNGNSSFMDSARMNKKVNDAQNSANIAAGMAGAAIGMSAASSSR